MFIDYHNNKIQEKYKTFISAKSLHMFLLTTFF